LQSELVDHLAIEAGNNLNEHLRKYQFKFGVFGFMDVVEKRAVLGKKYNSIVWKHFKDFFSVRKLF
jgi:hypothetical protein